MKAVFWDKDGTLVKNVPYNANPELVELVDGAGDSIKRLYDAGYQAFIVTNQSGIARGFFTEEEFYPVIQKMKDVFAEFGVPLLDFYYCPHHPDGSIERYKVECKCRKPLPGLLLKAAMDHGIDLQKSWMIGDILDDIEAGERAGCRTVLLNNGGEDQWVITPLRKPDYFASDIQTVTNIILSDV